MAPGWSTEGDMLCSMNLMILAFLFPDEMDADASLERVREIRTGRFRIYRVRKNGDGVVLAG